MHPQLINEGAHVFLSPRRIRSSAAMCDRGTSLATDMSGNRIQRDTPTYNQGEPLVRRRSIVPPHFCKFSKHPSYANPYQN